MKNKLPLRFAFSNPRVLIILFLTCFGVFLALLGSGVFAAAEERQTPPKDSGIQFGQSYHNDVSPPLRELAVNFRPGSAQDREAEEGREARINPKLPLPLHVDAPDPVVDHGLLGILVPDAMPATVLNFDGMQAACGGCAPPDTDGAVGATQYVQVDNVSYQVFNKITGGSTLGPALIQSIWSGFGGVCQSSGQGDPVVLYDHLANRWLISQFAGSNISDECIAISTGSDATGSYNRYAFHLGANAFDYPKIGIWPDGYYMSANVFNNSSPFNFLGPQAIAFDRANMLTGAAATFVTPGVTGGAGEPSFLPSDLDGAILPTAGVGNPFVSFPGTGSYKVRLFHADFAIPGLTTFTLIGAPAAAGFTAICPSTRNCVPELGGEGLDAIGDRLMFRLAYRKFLDGHEAVVSNYTVSSGGVAGVRWFELRAVTTAPVVAQESTYQPDSTWRWMGSAAMDFAGDLAVGFSASSASIHPQIRYAGRLVGDPANTLAQGEATIVSGAGSQSANGNRWGDYSAMSLDPVDDCTFWYTQEYFSVTGINWKTRIANFKFPGCLAVTPTPSPTPTATATFTPTSTPTVTATATSTPTIPPTPTPTPTPSPIVAATVALPTATISTSLTSFVQPVTTTNLNASDNLVGFQGDFTFNSTVVTFQVTPAQGAGLTANNWTVTGNILPGGGSIRTLRISAFANNFVPLSGSGTLFQLNMTRVGGNGTSSALTWKVAPDNFFFVDGDLQSHAPTSTPLGNIAFQTGATVNMSGTVSYCSNPVPGPVPGVTLTMTGNTAASTSSDGSGNYSFSALPSGGSFTVTPTKADRAPGSAGINTVDVVAVQRHFLNITLLAPGCSTTAADVNLDTLITTTDVIAIQRFAIGLSSGIANAGMYQFNPASSAYPGITSNQTAQNYGTFVLGDVVSPFAERVGGPSQETAELPSTVASVALPEIAADQSRSNVIAAVKSTAVEPTNKLVGFQGDFTFDERVVTFENEPVQKAGITSGNWNVSGNVLPGTGPIRTLRVSAYSNDFTPLSGSGTLFELRMRTVSNSALRTPHSAFPLLWAAPPNQFIFIDADLKTQRPGNAAPGSVGANH